MFDYGTVACYKKILLYDAQFSCCLGFHCVLQRFFFAGTGRYMFPSCLNTLIDVVNTLLVFKTKTA